MPSPIQGLMAALLTPRSPDGEVDLETLERSADFAVSRGAQGIVPCGGTGEYFDIPMERRQEMAERLAGFARGRCELVVGVGAARISESIQLGRHALESGAAAVLLPSPYFYRYSETDLMHFFREAARAIGGPVLLYNLAGFLSPIGAGAAVELVRSEPHIVGIKDSSGTLDILRRLTSDGIDCVRIQGHDARLPESFREGLLDCAVSGPACVVPEMSAAMFETFGDDAAFAQAARFNDEFLQQFAHFPYPWALKWIAGWRGICRPSLPFRLSPEREQAKREFRAWFDAWLDRLQRWRKQPERRGA